MEVFDTKTILTVAHIIGAVCGAGGAIVSDALFFAALKDDRLDLSEYRLFKAASMVIWIGVGVLVVSGVGLFLMRPEVYMVSAKFLSKMTIVVVIIANGVLFHQKHLPRMLRLASTPGALFHPTAALVASGAVSITSWVWALVLGSMRGLPWSFWSIIGVYVLSVLVAVGIALFIFRKR